MCPCPCQVQVHVHVHVHVRCDSVEILRLSTYPGPSCYTIMSICLCARKRSSHVFIHQCMQQGESFLRTQAKVKQAVLFRFMLQHVYADYFYITQAKVIMLQHVYKDYFYITQAKVKQFRFMLQHLLDEQAIQHTRDKAKRYVMDAAMPLLASSSSSSSSSATDSEAIVAGEANATHAWNAEAEADAAEILAESLHLLQLVRQVGRCAHIYITHVCFIRACVYTQICMCTQTHIVLHTFHLYLHPAHTSAAVCVLPRDVCARPPGLYGPVGRPRLCACVCPGRT